MVTDSSSYNIILVTTSEGLFAKRKVSESEIPTAVFSQKKISPDGQYHRQNAKAIVSSLLYKLYIQTNTLFRGEKELLLLKFKKVQM